MYCSVCGVCVIWFSKCNSYSNCIELKALKYFRLCSVFNEMKGEVTSDSGNSAVKSATHDSHLLLRTCERTSLSSPHRFAWSPYECNFLHFLSHRNGVFLRGQVHESDVEASKHVSLYVRSPIPQLYRRAREGISKNTEQRYRTSLHTPFSLSLDPVAYL